MRAALVLGLFVALTAVMTYPQVTRLSSAIANHEDPLLSIWRLSWIAHQLARDPAHLFDGNIFYPERRALAFSDAVLLPGIAAAPLSWLGLSNVFIYNVLLLLAFAASGAASYLLVHSLTGSRGAAWLAGIIFAFAPYRFAHFEHLELQFAFWMPLGLWALHQTLQTCRWRYALLMSAMLVGQALSSLYYFLFFGLFLAVVGGVLLFLQPRGRRLVPLRALIASVALAGVVIAPYTVPYFANRDVVGVRHPGEVRLYSALPKDYVTAPEENLVYGRPIRDAGRDERQLFPGALATILAIVAFWRPKRLTVVAYLVGLLFAFEASLGLNGWLYTWAYEHIAVFQGLRSPARFGLLVTLSIAVLAGFGASRILALAGPSRRPLVLAGLGAVLLLEYATAVRLTTLPPAPSVYAWLRHEPSSVIIELPVEGGATQDGLYMYFGTTHWQRLVNGYSGFYPPSYMALVEKIRGFPDDQSIAALRATGVKYAIVHGRYYTREEYVALAAALERRPDVEVVGRFPAVGGESLVYQVLPQTIQLAITP